MRICIGGVEELGIGAFVTSFLWAELTNWFSGCLCSKNRSIRVLNFTRFVECRGLIIIMRKTANYLGTMLKL